MKLNEISAELIDEMLANKPIKGILKHEILKKMKPIFSKDGISFGFHINAGWYYFSKETLKETERLFRKDCDDLIIEVRKTPKGYLYCFLSDTCLLFFKKSKIVGDTIEKVAISFDFSYKPKISEQHKYLLANGVEYYKSKYQLKFNKMGDLIGGGWQEEYKSEIKN